MPKAKTKPRKKVGAAVPAEMRKAIKALPKRKVEATAPAAASPGLKPIEVELARRAHIDSLYHRLVKPAPKAKRAG